MAQLLTHYDRKCKNEIRFKIKCEALGQFSLCKAQIPESPLRSMYPLFETNIRRIPRSAGVKEPCRKCST